MASYNEIPVSTLARLVGTPDCPVLLDVRIDEDFDADPHLIPGAVRQPFLDVIKLAHDLTGRPVVVYCQKGLKSARVPPRCCDQPVRRRKSSKVGNSPGEMPGFRWSLRKSCRH